MSTYYMHSFNEGLMYSRISPEVINNNTVRVIMSAQIVRSERLIDSLMCITIDSSHGGLILP